MQKAEKGTYGYIRREKKKRFAQTLALFLLPAVFLIIGIILNKGDRKNIYTVIAIVGSLPACRSAVGMIMMWMQKPMEKDHYESISKRMGNLESAYELYITSYDRSMMLEAVAICGEEVACYGVRVKHPKDVADMEAYIQKTLQANGYRTHVKIFTELNRYLERLDSLNAHYKKMSSDALVKHHLMLIAL